ncbi:hypothetical protein OL229_09710 [Neisseriaceae bacterium JH1-16]|nr:hypothetical protein [Neisseriaceae bacterium JH1-16]
MSVSISLSTQWQALQTRYGKEPPIVLLHLREQQTQLACPGNNALPNVITIPIGIATLYARHLSSRPTPASLEAAIMEVEDALAPVRAQLPVAGRLYGADPGLPLIARAAGLAACDADSQALSATAVEQLFQRYCQFVESGVPLRQDWPDTAPAALLILRELLHHLAFSDIHIVAERTE